MKSFKSDIAVPLYQQLYNTLIEQISLGEYAPGDQIPSEDKLCEAYGISRVTVRSAIKRLVDESILVKRHGKGTYVALPIFVESVSAGGSFTKSCLQRGAVPATRLIFCDTQPASTAVASRLGIVDGARVICAKRVRLVDDAATILEIDYFRSDFEFILSSDMNHQPLSDIIAEARGVSPTAFEDTFDIERAGREHCAALGCATGTPLLHIWQTVMADHRQVLYCNEQFILSTQYKYAVSYRAE